MYCIISKKNIIISFLSLIILSAITISCFVFAGATSSWGLSFSTPNQAPRGNVSSEELLKNDAYFMDTKEEKCVYLTFDVGYEAGYTESILDTLKKNDVKAAFFIVGNYFVSDADTVKRIVDEGHIVGNHTEKHPDMSKMSTLEDFKKQIIPVEEKYKAITGKDIPKYYRPPQGIYNTQNLKDAQSMGYKTIFWSVAYVDWEKDNQPTHEKAMDILLKRVHNGAIILLHSTSKTNMEILDNFICTLKNEGYTFKTLDDLGEVIE